MMVVVTVAGVAQYAHHVTREGENGVHVTGADIVRDRLEKHGFVEAAPNVLQSVDEVRNDVDNCCTHMRCLWLPHELSQTRSRDHL
ncbi:hypothetical protein FF1_014029 [Malus domestica]